MCIVGGKRTLGQEYTDLMERVEEGVFPSSLVKILLNEKKYAFKVEEIVVVDH